MYDFSVGDKTPKKIAEKFSFTGINLKSTLKFEGANREITDIYYWIFNFAYYTGKAFTTMKIEDYHYSSDSNQYAAQQRQVKGGAIQAFQQNLQQLIQLVKVHMFPLLKEVKQADFYNRWISRIQVNDERINKELKKSNPDQKKLEKWRLDRDEAISHLKDKWVTEVDGGKLWAINRPQSEQGLDYSLLPQLFFGTNLDDPLQRRSELKEQLDKTVYQVEISEGAKEQTARFLYRFYTWLPSAIRDTRMTFRMKVATLKQFYAQLEMYMEFMRPLLQEISKKREGFDSSHRHVEVEMEDPIYGNMFDSSYSFIRTLGVRNFAKPDRGPHNISDLNMNRFGVFIDAKHGDIWSGEAEGKTGFICDEVDGKYVFVECDKRNPTTKEFNKLKENAIKIDKKDLKVYPCMEIEFMQRRRTHIKQSPQGPMQVPYMQNTVTIIGKTWNMVEVAAYREKLKARDLEILESFISEIKVMKDDLMKYVGMLEDDDFESIYEEEEQSSSKSKDDSGNDVAKELVFGPFQGFYSLFKPLLPTFKFPSSKETKAKAKKGGHPKDNDILTVQINTLEDAWKVYTVVKKVHGFIMY